MTFNILFITHAEALYGAERCLVEITKYLDRSIIKPYVALAEKCLFADKFRSHNVEIVDFKAQSIALTLSTVWRVFKYNVGLIRCCSKYGIRIVHFNLAAHIETLGLFYLWAHFNRVKIFFHHRSPFAFSAMERWVLSLHYCICVSEAMRQQVIAPRKSDLFIRFSSQRMVALHDGNELERFTDNTVQAQRRSKYAGGEELIIGIVSALDPVKRLELFLQMAIRIVRDIPKAKFIIIGDIRAETEALKAYRKSLHDLTAASGLSKHVHFLGFQEDVASYYKIMDLFVLTSQRETLGGVLIEAMACGLPVISSAVDGTVEVVDPGVTGFLINSADPDAFAHCALQLLTDESLRRAFGQAAKQRAERMFDIRKQTRKLQDLFITAAQEGRS